MPIKDTSDDYLEWLQRHGIDITFWDRSLCAAIPIRCKELTEDGKCAIYDDRPMMCRTWECERGMA